MFRDVNGWTLANIGALASLALFTLAASSTGVSGPGLNSTIHIMGSATVSCCVLIPAIECRMTVNSA